MVYVPGSLLGGMCCLCHVAGPDPEGAQVRGRAADALVHAAGDARVGADVVQQGPGTSLYIYIYIYIFICMHI